MVIEFEIVMFVVVLDMAWFMSCIVMSCPSFMEML